jgi:hypothetical protein
MLRDLLELGGDRDQVCLNRFFPLVEPIAEKRRRRRRLEGSIPLKSSLRVGLAHVRGRAKLIWIETVKRDLV